MRLLRPCQGCAAKTLRPATYALPGLRCRGLCQATHGGGLSAQTLWLVRDRFSWRGRRGGGRRHRRCCGKSSAERKHLQRQQQFFFCPVELSSGMAALRKWLLTGLLVIVPGVITAWVLNWIVGMLDQTLLILPGAWQPDKLLGVHVPGFGVVLTLLILLLVGAIASNF